MDKLFAVKVYFNGADDEDTLPRCYLTNAPDEVIAERNIIGEIHYKFDWIVAEEVDFTGTDGTYAFTI